MTAPVVLDAIEASVAASGYGPWIVTRGVLPAVIRTNAMGEASVVAQASYQEAHVLRAAVIDKCGPS